LKIIAGIYQPDTGEIRFRGKPVKLPMPLAAPRSASARTDVLDDCQVRQQVQFLMNPEIEIPHLTVVNRQIVRIAKAASFEFDVFGTQRSPTCVPILFLLSDPNGETHAFGFSLQSTSRKARSDLLSVAKRSTSLQ